METVVGNSQRFDFEINGQDKELAFEKLKENFGGGTGISEPRFEGPSSTGVGSLVFSLESGERVPGEGWVEALMNGAIHGRPEEDPMNFLGDPVTRKELQIVFLGQ